MLPVASIEHQLPGRIRLRIPSKRGDHAYFLAAQEHLASKAGIAEVTANHQTGSLLIRHSADAQALERDAAESGLFTLHRPKHSAETGKRSSSRARSSAPSAPAAALSGLGLYQISQGRVLGSTSESFWNAYAAYANPQNPSLALVLCGIGLWRLFRGEWLGSASALLFYAAVLQRSPAETTDRPHSNA